MRPTDPRLRSQLAPARKPLAAVVAAGVVTSTLVIAQAFAVTALVVAVVRHERLLVPAVLVAASVLARVVTGWLGERAAARAAATVSARLRAEVTRATVAGRTSAMSEGELTALATRGVSAAEPYLTRYLPALVLAAVLPVLTVVAIATQDVLCAVIVIATLPLLPVFGALVGLATRDRAEEQWRAMASLSGHFVDVMRGLPTLVAFRRARAQSRTIRVVTDRYRQATVRTLRIAFASAAVLELVATLSVALVAVVVGVRLADGGLDLRTGLVVLLLAPEAYWPLRRVGAEFHAAAEGVATFETLSALQGSPQAADAPEPVDRATDGHRLLLGRELTFTYPGRTVPVVQRLDLAAAPASLTVLAGPSGCGKSTVLALLAGLESPDSGTVTSGGRPCTGAAWQSQVAWVPQRPAFVSGTVADNLRLAAPGATDAALSDVLDRVALSERVELLGGLDAEVGEDASLLSAGERARLALARALVSERPWIMLDEPTAHLDPVTRMILLDVVVEESARRGVIVVTHDPATIALADRVITFAAASVPPRAVAEAAPVPVPAQRFVAPEAEDGVPLPARFGTATVLGSLASLSGVALTATAGWLIVQASTQPPVLTMLVAIVGVRAFGLGRPVLRYAERLRSHDAALRLLADRRVEVYDALVPLTPGRLGKRRGDVLSSLVDDVDVTLDREVRVRLPLRTYVVVAAIATAVAALLLPVAVLTVGAISASGACLAYLVARLGCAGPERTAVAARARLSAALLDVAHLAPELRMWQAEDRALAEIADLGRALNRAGARVAGTVALARAVVLVSVGAGVVATAVVSADAVAAGRLSGPVAALLVLVPLALGDVAATVVEAGALEGRVRAAEERLSSLATTAPAVTDPDVAVDPSTDHDLRGTDLALGWTDHEVVTGLDVDVRPGERIAVVGPSGSGKSTLAATLVRFVDPLRGTLRLGERPLVELTLDSVRERVGLVDDDPHVFASTLAENIRLARPDADDEAVGAALQAACLGDWVASLPEGLGTWIGDGHTQVSGGERARLALARSLLADQPVLVLDEPVAHLDRATAEAVAADLLRGAGRRSVVWVTHSDIGLDSMDRIIDLGAAAWKTPVHD